MKRISTIAVAAFAATALAGPAPALAGGAHLQGIYKVEKHIDIQGEDDTYKIKCKTNDIAVDGMWRMDNVDQDNDFVYDPAPSGYSGLDTQNSVEPEAAYPSAVDEYTFKFVPTAGGDTQGKLFLTCLPAKVDTLGGHTVAWRPGATIQTKTLASATPPTNNSVTATYANVSDSTTPCLNTTERQIAIQPGFAWASGSYGKPYKRFPTTTPTPNYLADWNQWNWGFVSPTGGVVTLYWRCLPLRSDYSGPASTGHRHRIALQWVNKTTPATDVLKKKRISEVQVICGEHYKGMLGAWDFGYSSDVWGSSSVVLDPFYSASWNPSNYNTRLWYHGMDPRPKARAFKILNTDPANDVAAGSKFGLLCFKDKTT